MLLYGSRIDYTVYNLKSKDEESKFLKIIQFLEQSQFQSYFFLNKKY